MKPKIVILFALYLIVQCASAQNGYSYKDNSIFRGSETNPVGEGRKNLPLAVLYSLLLPGMGELYAGNYSSGKYHTIAEGVLWATFLAFDQYGRWVQTDARNYAVRHADITLSGKDDQFFIDIGDFQSVAEYNAYQLRRRSPYTLYDVRTESWNWDTKSNREYYRDLRVSSDQMFNSTNYIAAAIGINHLVSAINAALMVRSGNQGISRGDGIKVHASVMGRMANPHGIMISLTKSF